MDSAGIQRDSHASFRVQTYRARSSHHEFSAIVFLPRVQLSKYRGASFYGSVPINHLTHGPTIRLLERESYYPARLWWCTTSGPRWLDLESSPDDWAARKFHNVSWNRKNKTLMQSLCVCAKILIRNMIKFHVFCILILGNNFIMSLIWKKHFFIKI